MSWYDVFSGFYDRSLEKLYRDARAAAVEALALAPGMRVLDLPCGTGQSFDGIAPALGDAGRLVGGDLSRGMLKRAGKRVARLGLGNVEVVCTDVHALTKEAIGGPIDRLHVFLGMSAFPNPDEAFERLWGVLRPGGRAVVVDVFSERLGFQGRMVNLVARADIRRRSWEPLERRAAPGTFTRRDLPSLKKHGGTLFLAVGDKGVSGE
ncbi:MAG: class I SAM-dependent methyltransferase [Deltaproteobacteria bacterium]|nr:class I SAM-dependent methyltransferase [Deltaproteobacteria bacterium]